MRASNAGWSSPETLAALLAGAVLLAAFVARESRAAEPLVPLRLFRNRAFAVGNATMFCMSGAIFSAAFLILQEFQFARGYSPVAAGARLLPFFATPMLISPVAGAVSDRIGRRPVMVTGLTMQALGFTWVAARWLAGHELDRAHARAAARRHRHLGGPAHRAHRRAQCRRAARDGQGIGH